MKKQTLLLACLAILLIAPTSFVNAQETEETSNLSFGVDGVSRYIWRGINLGGSSPHLQPWVEYAFGESGLAIGAWGSYSLSLNAGAEADLYLSYSPVDWLGFTVTDYYFPADQPFERSDYFNYDADETGHAFEASVSLGGSDAIPFYAMFAMNFYGSDGINNDGDNANSKYIELGYNGSCKGGYGYTLFAGIAPDDPGENGTGWYGNEAPGLINLGAKFSKEVSILEKSLPVFSSVIFNPEAGNFFIVVGLSL